MARFNTEQAKKLLADMDDEERALFAKELGAPKGSSVDDLLKEIKAQGARLDALEKGKAPTKDDWLTSTLKSLGL